MRRRDLLTGIAGTVAATTLGAGASLMPGAAARAAGSRGGTFRLGWRWLQRLAPKRRPPEIYSTMEQWYAQLYWDGLTRYSGRGDWTPEPALALEWTPTKRGREWHFRIREDATWHTGAPVTAAQCAASLNALTHPDAPKHKAWKRIKRHRLMYPVSWRAVDATTLVGVSDEPEWALPSLLARPAYRIVDPTSPIAPKFADQVVGNGPFVCVEWSTDQGIIGRRYDGYYDDDLPRVDAIALQNYDGTKGKDQVAGLSRREVDATGPAVIRPQKGEAQRNFETVQKKYAGRVTFARTIMTTYQAAIAASKHTDPAVIEAIKAVLPRQEIAGKQWNGQGIIGADHPVSEAFGLALALDPVIADPDRAKHALARADIDRIRIYTERAKYKGSRDIEHGHARTLAQALGNIGIKTQLVERPIDARQRTGRGDIVWISRKSEGDAIHALWQLYGGSGPEKNAKRVNWRNIGDGGPLGDMIKQASLIPYRSHMRTELIRDICELAQREGRAAIPVFDTEIVAFDPAVRDIPQGTALPMCGGDIARHVRLA